MRLSSFEFDDPKERREVRRFEKCWTDLIETVQVTMIERLFNCGDLALEDLKFPDWPSSTAQKLSLDAISGLLMLDIITACSDDAKDAVDPLRSHLPRWQLVDEDIFDLPESGRGKWYADITARHPLSDGDV